MIYLASPYTSPDKKVMHKRYSEAVKATAFFIGQGFVVFSPIVHSHKLNMPTDFDFWHNYDMDVIASCSELWVLAIDGWDRSRGVTEELMEARSTRKPVFIVQPTGDQKKPFERQEYSRFLQTVRNG